MAYCDKANGYCSLMDMSEQIKALEAKEGKCKWTYDENYDMWETDCGGAFCLESGTPAENNMKYCSYCGKMIWTK